MHLSEKKIHLAFERMVFFSDAVFAIAITLLVIEIRIPILQQPATEARLWNAFLQVFPMIVGFFISFLLIGQTWIEHHRLCLFIEGYNSGLLWKNLILLLFVAFLPLATAILSEYYYLRFAACVYTVAFAGISVAKAFFWRHAVRNKLIGPGVDPIQVTRASRRVWAAPIVCLS
ncbi:MAG TPA: TMEM175 family protein [Candidatus Acidoferrales bacterium]|nr:TMEM175 family protein [Candidatus Acidoferrales bacterium]